ncbi:trypsin-like cysteine/serine peptidase domain-containing protein [Pseudomassariella vexata]|uniref:Serine protease n=1 Tax=Pseudomassariella vexata TaxID=1141098 RepID=A0A1Y2E4Y5_9PEZI|nr:trypsin-like cysteine/serine peptidase domain-containing protein [Pseudomassariella vexata]ORY66620.1 trypsin-like cysteine/serine peptidase domain-containing protein [Pseudomassariella vexata]
MVLTQRHTAAIVLTLFYSVSALPTTQVKQDELYTQPIGNLGESFKPTGPPPTIIQLTPSNLASVGHVTEVPSLFGLSSPYSDTDEDLAERGIVGVDNRVVWNSTDYPYSAMGRLIWSTGAYCTGTLVGPRHVATARHCSPSDDQTGITVTFQPDYFNGERFPSSKVGPVLSLSGVDVVNNPDACDYKNDWAIMVLDDPLGNDRGYMGAKTVDSSLLKRAIFYHLGYPLDLGQGERQYRQYPITISSSTGCDAYGPMVTDADADSGQSGGPLWLPPDAAGDRYMYGVASSTSSTGTNFAGGDAFLQGIAYVRQNYP